MFDEIEEDLKLLPKNMDGAVVSVLIVVISIICYVKLLLKPGDDSNPPLPPGPRGVPILGYLPFLGNNILHKFRELEHKYGPIYKLHLGKKQYVVISSPTLVKEVARDQDAVFANRDIPVAVRVATFGGNDIAWSQHNSHWRAMRKIFVQEMMSHTSFAESYTLRKEEVRKAIKDVYMTKIGKPIDVGGELCFPTETNVLMNMSWGGTVVGEFGERIAAEFQEVVSKIMDLIGKPNISDYYPGLARFDFQGIKKQMESYVQSLDRIFDTVIAEHKKKQHLSGDHEIEITDGKKDFLQFLMLELNDDEKLGDSEEKSIDQRQLRAMLMDVIGGSSDTSATIEWAMAELMNNPQVMAKAQNEVSDVVGFDNIADEFHIPKLKYLEAVVRETLRLHPPVPLLIPRSPSKASRVGGYTIPKDTVVHINIWSIHRDPSIWDNPTEFKPERFVDGIKLPDQFQYLPFGVGRRICAGRALAERMIIYFLASLLHSFDWKLEQGEQKLDMSEKYGLVLRKTTPLVVVPNPRLPNPNLYLI